MLEVMVKRFGEPLLSRARPAIAKKKVPVNRAHVAVSPLVIGDVTIAGSATEAVAIFFPVTKALSRSRILAISAAL